MTQGTGKGFVEKKNITQAFLRQGKKSLLGRLDMELTERCNNNCVHCCINLPENDTAARSRELSTEEIKGILKEAAALGCLTVRFTGGEPLLREDFDELYVFARRSGLKVLIFTNATLIDERRAELFSRMPPLEKIEVSVYGMKKSSYGSVTRNPASFEAAWRGIGLLLEKKIPFVVKSAFLPQNKSELKRFVSWAKKIPAMEKQAPSFSWHFDLRHRRDKDKNGSIERMRASFEERQKYAMREPQAYRKEMRRFCSQFMRPPGDKLFSCGAGCGGCVDAYGKFQPCLPLRHPGTVYDLKNGTLKDALENFFPKLRRLKTKNPEYLSRCAKCFLKGLCEQCPAKSYMEKGTLDTPVETLCERAHREACFLGLLKEDEKGWQVDNWRSRIGDFSNEKKDQN